MLKVYYERDNDYTREVECSVDQKHLPQLAGKPGLRIRIKASDKDRTWIHRNVSGIRQHHLGEHITWTGEDALFILYALHAHWNTLQD